MKVGIISDTHDRLPAFKLALERFKQEKVRTIIHAGDLVAPFAAKLIAPAAMDPLGITVHCIYGNNDGERPGLAGTLPQIQDGPVVYDVADRRIAVHHYLDWFSDEDVRGTDLVVSGHDHTAKIDRRDGRVYLNPGECCGWVTGRCTAAVVETQTLDIDLFDIHV